MSTAKGKLAEDKATAYLVKQGYDIIERNRRLGRGELDIIAQQEDVLVFVEVKGHQFYESSLNAMHDDKQRRIISAAQTWLGQHAIEYGDLQCRFDLIVVTPSTFKLLPAKIEHLKDIIRL
ncbi:MAG: YraN family protein [Ghiorsea sp.]